MDTSTHFEIQISAEDNLLLITAAGKYSLTKAIDLFKQAIDNAVIHDKSRVLVDVTNLAGNIPFFDRFEYSKFVADYIRKQAFGQVHKLAVMGQEPIVHKDKFGETVAVNRGANVRVFTDKNKALTWLGAVSVEDHP